MSRGHSGTANPECPQFGGVGKWLNPVPLKGNSLTGYAGSNPATASNYLKRLSPGSNRNRGQSATAELAAMPTSDQILRLSPHNASGDRHKRQKSNLHSRIVSAPRRPRAAMRIISSN